jgi:hypothetical protein
MLSPNVLIRWIQARQISATGRGPFSSETLRALLRNECMRCGCLVSDYALLSNSLVVHSGSIVTQCRECRGGGPNPKNVGLAFGKLYVSSLIVEIDRHTCSEFGRKLDWHEALICTRQSFAFFQSANHQPYDAFTWARSRIKFGELMELRNCGECGAFWSKDREWNPTVCWHCGLPHELQWHMRTTASSERDLLFQTQTSRIVCPPNYF